MSQQFTLLLLAVIAVAGCVDIPSKLPKRLQEKVHASPSEARGLIEDEITAMCSVGAPEDLISTMIDSTNSVIEWGNDNT